MPSEKPKRRQRRPCLLSGSRSIFQAEANPVSRTRRTCTGALSDRLGRKWLIAAGLWVQAAGIALVVVSSGFTGYAAGALVAGIAADRLGLGPAILCVAAVTFASGLVVAARMRETLR